MTKFKALARFESVLLFLLLVGSLGIVPDWIGASLPLVQAQLGQSSTVAEITGLPIVFSETPDYVRLDFTMFAIEFYKGTQGYNKIYDRFGNVLVYNDRIVLEYLFKAPDTWKQRGTPISVSWTKFSDFHYEVIRKYDDYAGTTYEVKYTVKSDSLMKITVKLTSGQMDDYRIAWYPSGIVKAEWQRKGNRLVFGDEAADYGWVGFDWEDVYQGFGDITSVSTEDVAQGKKANIYFNIGTVEAGKTVTVDPSVVGTSASIGATKYPFQRKSFYVNGRFWVFYADGTNMVYRTSTDGSSWSAATTVRASANGNFFSIWYDGTYFHYARASFSSISYRRGTPNADGTVTWSAAEQTVSTTFNSVYDPFVSVDSNGYVWIGYEDYSSNDACYYPYVIKSGNNDGTWGTTPSGFPYCLTWTTGDVWAVSAVPLTAGKMLAVYTHDASSYVKMRSWTGSAWNAEVATTISTVYYNDYSVVAEGNDAHIVFLKWSYLDILHVKYTYSTNSLSSEHTVKAATTYLAPVLSISGTKLYCFWATKTTGSPTGAIANHIYYQTSTDGGVNWSSMTDWINESTEVLTRADILTCFYQTYNNYIGLVYLTKIDSPYNVKFAFLSLNTAPVNDASVSTAAFDVNVYGWVNMTVSDADGVANLQTVDTQVTTADSKTFTLRWTQSSNAFSEVSDASGICILDASGSVRVNIDSDTDKIASRFKISVGAQKGYCSVQATTTDDVSASDVDTYTDKFSINFYLEIAINDATHGWTGLSPGSSNAQLNSGGGSDGDVDVTVSANAPFNLQAKGSGNLVSGSNSIPLSNVKVHKDTLGSAASLTTIHANIGGLTSQARGENLANSFILWITVPNPCAAGTYTYTLYVQGVSS